MQRLFTCTAAETLQEVPLQAHKRRPITTCEPQEIIEGSHRYVVPFLQKCMQPLHVSRAKCAKPFLEDRLSLLEVVALREYGEGDHVKVPHHRGPSKHAGFKFSRGTAHSDHFYECIRVNAA